MFLQIIRKRAWLFGFILVVGIIIGSGAREAILRAISTEGAAPQLTSQIIPNADHQSNAVETTKVDAELGDEMLVSHRADAVSAKEVTATQTDDQRSVAPNLQLGQGLAG